MWFFVKVQSSEIVDLLIENWLIVAELMSPANYQIVNMPLRQLLNLKSLNLQ
jgi:hypothetical protein